MLRVKENSGGTLHILNCNDEGCIKRGNLLSPALRKFPSFHKMLILLFCIVGGNTQTNIICFPVSGHPFKGLMSFWFYHRSCYTSSKIIQVDMHICMCAHICACDVYVFICANTGGHVCLCMCVHRCYMYKGI